MVRFDEKKLQDFFDVAEDQNWNVRVYGRHVYARFSQKEANVLSVGWYSHSNDNVHRPEDLGTWEIGISSTDPRAKYFQLGYHWAVMCEELNKGE